MSVSKVGKSLFIENDEKSKRLIRRKLPICNRPIWRTITDWQLQLNRLDFAMKLLQ